MELSVSILSIKEELNKKIKQLEQTNIDYIHLDIMDGIFVENISDYENIETKKPLDIHLMVKDIEKYINKYKKLKPEYITFHEEATSEIEKIISEIKKENIKVGLSINPYTELETIGKYLNKIDLVLIMSVIPGKGGQSFIKEVLPKIEKLYQIRQENNYNFKIEVDGGINNETITYLSKADIAVSGSYITNTDNYEEKIRNLKK